MDVIIARRRRTPSSILGAVEPPSGSFSAWRSGISCGLGGFGVHMQCGIGEAGRCLNRGSGQANGRDWVAGPEEGIVVDILSQAGRWQAK